VTSRPIPAGAARPAVLAALLVLAVLAALPAGAQGAIDGRVLRGGQGLPGVEVELHRVSTAGSGVVGTARSGDGGVFRLALPAAAGEGFDVLFATATLDGVRYFGPAVHPGADTEGYVVRVYDTTAAPADVAAVRVSRRDIVLVAGPRGGWEVAEVVRVENPLERTVVGEGGAPLFGFGVPLGAADLQTEDPMLADDGGPGELVLMGGRVLATTPLLPGARDFFFRYRVPPGSGSLSLGLATAVDSLTMYIREPAPGVRVEGLDRAGPFEADGDRFARFVGSGLAADARITVRSGGGLAGRLDPRLGGGGAALLVLLAGALIARRRRPDVGRGGTTA
jgi:hypothetical protein